MTMWVLGSCDRRLQLMGDHRTCQEFLALLALALEQVCHGWGLEDSLSPHLCLEEPPSVMFQGRPQAVVSSGETFCQLGAPNTGGNDAGLHQRGRCAA